MTVAGMGGYAQNIDAANTSRLVILLSLSERYVIFAEHSNNVTKSDLKRYLDVTRATRDPNNVEVDVTLCSARINLPCPPLMAIAKTFC